MHVYTLFFEYSDLKSQEAQPPNIVAYLHLAHSESVPVLKEIVFAKPTFSQK